MPAKCVDTCKRQIFESSVRCSEHYNYQLHTTMPSNGPLGECVYHHQRVINRFGCSNGSAWEREREMTIGLFAYRMIFHCYPIILRYEIVTFVWNKLDGPVQQNDICVVIWLDFRRRCWHCHHRSTTSSTSAGVWLWNTSIQVEKSILHVVHYIRHCQRARVHIQFVLCAFDSFFFVFCKRLNDLARDKQQCQIVRP